MKTGDVARKFKITEKRLLTWMDRGLVTTNQKRHGQGYHVEWENEDIERLGDWLVLRKYLNPKVASSFVYGNIHV
jgi:DNA-binding transcriptional MerR regulator